MGVSSGPLRARCVRLIESSVASGIGSPYLATPAMPATCSSQAMSAPAALRIRTVAAVIDGPMPSPGISVTCVVIRRRKSFADEEIGDAAGERTGEWWAERRHVGADDVAEPSNDRPARIDER